MVELWRIRLEAPAAALEDYEAVLGDFGAVTAFSLPDTRGGRIDPGADRPSEIWRLEILSESEPDLSAVALMIAGVVGRLGLEMPDIHLDRVPPVDWLAQNRAQSKPVRAGRFFVRPSFDETPPPPGSLALRLDAGPAFGSGQHPTTHGCLTALDELLRRRRFARPLDLGCGSGILALAIAARQHRRVLAIDNDPWAVRTTRDNARLNRLMPWVEARLGHGLRQVSRGVRFDLICANILARPLIALAPAVAAHLAEDGVVVLSGLLDYQEPGVRAAYRRHGFALARRLVGRSGDGGLWPTLVLAR